MINIRLLMAFKCDHHELPVGEVVGVRPDRALGLVQLGMAEYAEAQHAVVEPQETRMSCGYTPPEVGYTPECTASAELPRRRPGRPPRQPQEKV